MTSNSSVAEAVDRCNYHDGCNEPSVHSFCPCALYTFRFGVRLALIRSHIQATKNTFMAVAIAVATLTPFIPLITATITLAPFLPLIIWLITKSFAVAPDHLVDHQILCGRSLLLQYELNVVVFTVSSIEKVDNIELVVVYPIIMTTTYITLSLYTVPSGKFGG